MPAALPSVHHKTARADLRSQYILVLEISFILTLGLLVLLARAPLRTTATVEPVMMDQERVQMEEVQQTNQVEPPPPPPRPSVPIAVSDDTVLENDELDLDASLDLEAPLVKLPLPPTPATPAEEKPKPPPEPEVFIAVEEMPELIGGLASIQKELRYPEIARRAGLEGRVFVEFIVDEKGNVVDPVVLKGIGGGCDEEAVRAVMTAKFKPGRQRGKAVRVRYVIPVLFKMKAST